MANNSSKKKSTAGKSPLVKPGETQNQVAPQNSGSDAIVLVVKENVAGVADTSAGSPEPVVPKTDDIAKVENSPVANDEKKQKNSNPVEVSALFIKSKAEHFHRCGFKFNREGFGIALECLTEDEIERLKNESELDVEEVLFNPNDCISV